MTAPEATYSVMVKSPKAAVLVAEFLCHSAPGFVFRKVLEKDANPENKSGWLVQHQFSFAGDPATHKVVSNFALKAEVLCDSRAVLSP